MDFKERKRLLSRNPKGLTGSVQYRSVTFMNRRQR